MNPKNIFKNLSLKYKLLVVFWAALLPILAIGSTLAYSVIKTSFLANVENELRNSTATLVQMVHTSASVAIQSYLRAVAEKNLEVVRHHYQEIASGRIDREEAIADLYTLFGRQTIGRSGYIYCLNGEGKLTYHPLKTVQGRDIASFAFAREQIDQKTGYLEYQWKNPDDAEERPKALYMVYFEPLDWIISVSAYRDEFSQLIDPAIFCAGLEALRFGQSGHAFLIDRHGLPLVREEPATTTPWTNKPLPADLLAQMLEQHQGQLMFEAQDSQNHPPQRQWTYFNELPHLGWIVGTTYPIDEIYRPLRQLSIVCLLTALFIAVMAGVTAFWFGGKANRVVQDLIGQFAKGAAGDFSSRLTYDAKDELGRLAGFFNRYMVQLEAYHHGLLSEIEQRRLSEEQLQAHQRQLIDSETKYRQLYETSFDGFVMTDAQIKIIECNSAFEQMVGYRLDELRTMDATQLTPDVWRAVQRRQFDDYVHTRGYSEIFEKEYLRKDGSLLPVEIRFHKVMDGQGRLLGHWAFVRDIAKRKESEKELSKLVMAVEQANDIIVITDTEGLIEYVNPAFEKATGFTRNEVIGLKPSRLKSGRHEASFYEELWRTITAGNSWTGRFINKKKNGQLFYEDAIITPLRDEGGHIVNYVAAKRDVTDQIQLENQLRHAQRMEAIGTLAGGIAHDFNNILSGIMGYVEISKFDVPKGSAIGDRLDKALQACHRAKELIRHIQTFSRKASVEVKPILPTPIVKEALKLLRASVPSSIEFKTMIHDVGIIQADPTQLHQIVMNLGTNAYHAMKPNQGTLSVTLTEERLTPAFAQKHLDISPGSYAKLSVTDTGHGIAADIREKIFDPYFTTKGEGEGSGLGLAVVHGIVKGLKGAVRVYSELNQGTTFTIYLPLLDSEDTTQSEDPPEVPLGQGETVLVVDDEETVLEITQDLLISLNYQPVAIHGATEGVKAFEATPERFQVVVTDLTMPHMNGLQLAQRVKANRPDLPVILISGFSHQEAVEIAVAKGLVRLLHKPLERSNLAECLRQCLQA